MSLPEWYRDAACRGADIELFFASTDGGYVDYSEALAICARCPVVGPCLERNGHERHGVFGGTTPGQRFEADEPVLEATGACHGCGAPTGRLWCDSPECRAKRHARANRRWKKRRGAVA